MNVIGVFISFTVLICQEKEKLLLQDIHVFRRGLSKYIVVKSIFQQSKDVTS